MFSSKNERRTNYSLKTALRRKKEIAFIKNRRREKKNERKNDKSKRCWK